MDALRQERVGVVSEGPASFLVQAYVKTEDTDERRAYDPIEGMARPFPLLLRAPEPTVVERPVEHGELQPVSDELVEHIEKLRESVSKGTWVDGVENYENNVPEDEQQLAQSLLLYVSEAGGRGPPRELWRTVYNSATEVESLDDSKFRDIEGRERYNFSYLPEPNAVDEWSLLLSTFEEEMENGDVSVSNSLWLRYTSGGSQEERPLLARNNVGFVANSRSPDFGDEMEDAPVSLVKAILSGEDNDYFLTPVDTEKLDGTTTKTYLEEYVDEH